MFRISFVFCLTVILLSGCVPTRTPPIIPVQVHPRLSPCIEDIFNEKWDGSLERVYLYIKPIDNLEVSLNSESDGNQFITAYDFQEVLSDVVRTAFFQHPYAMKRFRVLQEIDISRIVQKDEMSDIDSDIYFMSIDDFVMEIGGLLGAQVSLILSVPSINIKENSQTMHLLSMSITMEIFDIKTRKLLSSYTETVEREEILSIKSIPQLGSIVGSMPPLNNFIEIIDELTLCTLNNTLIQLR